MKEVQIRTVIKEKFPFLKEADIEMIFSLAKILHFKNKELIIIEGQPAPFIYFIASGMVRGYRSDESGVQRTLIIRPTQTFFAPPGILKDLVVSDYSFESIKDTTLFRMPLEKFIALTEEHISFAQLYINLLRENLQTVFFRVELLAGMSPEDRYEALLKSRPELFEKSFHKHVANYLGMTPTSLSRIIKRKKELES